MGNIEITGEEFSFEWDSVENPTPPGSDDLPEQAIIHSIQYLNEGFYYHIIPVENSTPLESADLPIQSVLQNIQHLNEGFYYHIISAENSTPLGSADIGKQPVLQNIQHYGEHFFFVLELIREKTLHIHIQDLRKRPLEHACIEVTNLDHPGTEPDVIYTNRFGNVVYVVPILSRYRFKVSKLYFKTVTFELGMLTSQPAVRGIRTLLQDFKFVIKEEENEEPVSNA